MFHFNDAYLLLLTDVSLEPVGQIPQILSIKHHMNFPGKSLSGTLKLPSENS